MSLHEQLPFTSMLKLFTELEAWKPWLTSVKMNLYGIHELLPPPLPSLIASHLPLHLLLFLDRSRSSSNANKTKNQGSRSLHVVVY